MTKPACYAKNPMRSLTYLFITLWTMPASIKRLFQESQWSKTFSSLCYFCTYYRAIRSIATWEMFIDDNDKARTQSLKGSAGPYRARENFSEEGSSTQGTQNHCLAECLWSCHPYWIEGLGEAGKCEDHVCYANQRPITIQMDTCSSIDSFNFLLMFS